MKKALLFAFMAALLLVPMAAFAADITDTDTFATTKITAGKEENILQYKDIGDVLQITAESSTITVEVAAMYGLAHPIADFVSQTTTVGTMKSYDYVITNEGNASTTFTITVDCVQSGGASGWKVELFDGETLLVSQTDDGLISTTEVLSEDEYRILTVKVTPSSTPANSLNGARLDHVLTFSTTSTPVGDYTGANGTEYGGAASAADAAYTIIAGPVMTLTRTATVDSPQDYIDNASGAATAHDAVPGAVITYKINYINSGSSSGESVIIIDKVPDNTTAGHLMGLADVLTGVTITSLPSSDAGWAVSYSTSDTPDRYYGGSTGWTLSAVDTDIHATPDIKYIKFEKLHVDVDETKDLTWGVIIK